MVYNSAKVQRHTVACSIVVYKPNCKAKYTVTTGPKYYVFLTVVCIASCLQTKSNR